MDACEVTIKSLREYRKDARKLPCPYCGAKGVIVSGDSIYMDGERVSYRVKTLCPACVKESVYSVAI